MSSSIYKYLIFLPLLIGCTKTEKAVSGSVPTFDEHVETAKKVEISKPVDTLKYVSEGKVIIESSDCLGCHKVNETMIGPSYADVAKKYSAKDLDYLASKIIEGGSGVWGNVPMPAHNGLSKENSQKMVYYILSNKK